jgi:hypothetical protein
MPRPSAFSWAIASSAAELPCAAAWAGSIRFGKELQEACRPTYVGMSVQPCAMVWVTQSAVRLAWVHPRLAPPMYMLAAL